MVPGRRLGAVELSRRSLILLLAASLLLVPLTALSTAQVPEPAASTPRDLLGVVFGVIGDELVVVNRDCGAATTQLVALGDTLGLVNPDLPARTALTYDPATLTLFGFAGHADGDNKLIEVDLLTGVSSVVGPVTVDGVPYMAGEALAYNPADGQLYAFVSSAGSRSNVLVTVDRETAQATVVAPLGSTREGGDADSMAFLDGTLYILDSRSTGNADLYEVDPATGATTHVGATGAPLIDLAPDPLSGLLLAVDHFSHRLMEVNPATGVATEVGTTHDPLDHEGESMRGLALGLPLLPTQLLHGRLVCPTA